MNTTTKTPAARAYRGEYPNRIKAVSAFGSVWVMANDGRAVRLSYEQVKAAGITTMPKLGDDITPLVAAATSTSI